MSHTSLEAGLQEGKDSSLSLALLANRCATLNKSTELLWDSTYLSGKWWKGAQGSGSFQYLLYFTE